MKGRLSKGALVAAAVVIVGATAATATTALQSIVGADGVIHGCFKSQNGQLRVVAEGETCGPSEQALAWNQVGPRGPQGSPGPQGDKGEKGDEGDKGDTGEAGPEGIQGIQGIQGLQGLQGERGLQGVPGERGLQGPAGDKGDVGPPGPAGPHGVGGLEYVVAHGVATQGGAFGRFPLEARCPAGKKVLGGGFGSPNLFRAISNKLAVFSSEPSGDQGGWYVFVTNVVALPTDEAFDVWAICASG